MDVENTAFDVFILFEDKFNKEKCCEKPSKKTWKEN